MSFEIISRKYIVVKKFYFNNDFIKPHYTFEEGSIIITNNKDYDKEFKNYHDCMVEENLFNNIKSYLRREKINKVLEDDKA